MAFVFILFPLLMAALAAALPSNRLRPWLLPVTGVGHFALTVFTLAHPELTTTAAWLVLDPPGRLILLEVSLLYVCCSFYATGYLRNRNERPNRIFCVCLMTFLSVMSLVMWAHHLGLMWVAIEATTLVTAPLIFFNHTQHSIEATWKYMLVGSVGIALALLGTFFLAYAALHTGLEASLTLEDLLKNAPHPASEACGNEWKYPYSREQAVFPANSDRGTKFWPPIARIDNVFGDRHLVCRMVTDAEYQKLISA